MKRELLNGGNSNVVFKEGNTVLRLTGAWSPFVHDLLRHLAAAGFQEAPRFIEQTGEQERLSFFEGEVGNDPLKLYMQSDEILVEAAKLLRRLHDATQDFALAPHYVYQLPVTTTHEVICHNDFAPYNCVFSDGHIIGIIDFDTASPGTRLWDIAYAVYRFVPLMNDSHCHANGWQSSPDRGARLKLFCDTYDLKTRETLITTVRARLQTLVDYMRQTSSNVEHLPFYLADLAFVEAHAAEFNAALMV